MIFTVNAIGISAISLVPSDWVPRNLGGSGYYGRESMYLQTSTVATALDTEGATLDFFRIFAKIVIILEI